MIVVDSSAILAVLLLEKEAQAISEVIETSPRLLISAVNYVESSIVCHSRAGQEGLQKLDSFLFNGGIEIAPITGEQAFEARAAHMKFGKGNHASGLNICDCFAYALAKFYTAPLLFKGNDFSKTDVIPALI